MNNKELSAYPIEGSISHQGLTKLEAFTLAAMQGLLSNPVMGEHVSGIDCIEDITETALEFAEAQLNLIEKKKEMNNE